MNEDLQKFNKESGEYYSDLGEKIVEKVFNFCGLITDKIPRLKGKGQKTADFFVKNKDNNIVVICEVETITNPTHPDEFLNNDTIFNGKEKERRKKQTLRLEKRYFSKTEEHYNYGMKQLINYTKSKILFFISFDMADYQDLDGCLLNAENLGQSIQRPDLYIWLNVQEEIYKSRKIKIKKGKITPFSLEGKNLQNFIKSANFPIELNL